MLEVGIFVFGIKIPSVAEDEKTGGKVNRDTIVSWQKCSKRTMSATNDHQFVFERWAHHKIYFDTGQCCTGVIKRMTMGSFSTRNAIQQGYGE